MNFGKAYFFTSQPFLRKIPSVYEYVVVKNSPLPKDFFLKDPRAKNCFDKYPEVNERHNYKRYLGRD
jgi:hypothetical protein